MPLPPDLPTELPPQHPSFPETPPSPWVVSHAAQVNEGTGSTGSTGRNILDLASGGGRHSKLFLDRGCRVTAVDIDLSAMQPLAENPNLTLVKADLEAEAAQWPLADRQFDGVVVTNYLWRPLLGHIRDAIAPGGVLIYETFAVGNEAFGQPRNPDFLLQPGELLDHFHGPLTVVAYEFGPINNPRPAIVQRICARKDL